MREELQATPDVLPRYLLAYAGCLTVPINITLTYVFVGLQVAEGPWSVAETDNLCTQ